MTVRPKLPKGNGSGCCHIQGIDFVRHGDTCHIIGLGQGGLVKTIPFSTQDDDQPLDLFEKRSSQVQGTKKTVPIDTRIDRRFRGSHELVVSKTASMPKAAADRKIAPMLVVSTTPSIKAMRLAVRQIVSTVGNSGLRMAQSTPRVKV